MLFDFGDGSQFIVNPCVIVETVKHLGACTNGVNRYGKAGVGISSEAESSPAVYDMAEGYAQGLISAIKDFFLLSIFPL